MAAPTVKEYLQKCINDTSAALFSSDELQAILDLHKTHVLYEQMRSDAANKRFYSRHRFLTDATLWDSSDEDNQTEYTPDTSNLLEGWFEFDTAQDKTLYLKAYSYNVYAAAAGCWLIIGSTKSELFSASVGQGYEMLSQVYDHAIAQYQYFTRLAYPPGSGSVGRIYD